MKKIFLTAFVFITSIFGGFVYHINLKQDELIFRSVKLEKEHVFELKHPYEEIYLKNNDQSEIHSLWFKNEKPKGVVLFFHGRGKNLNFWSFRAYPFIERGYDVFIIDYRGFGKSSKGFKESWFLEDGDTAYNFLKAKYPENKIFVYGHSMGTSIATWVASQHDPNKLILEAPFYSMIDAACYLKPYIPEFLVRMILKYHLRTDLWIEKVKVPITIFHGVPDKIIPYKQSLMLYEKIKHRENTEIVILSDAGHADIHENPVYIKKLNELMP
jgi:pimeloyl-ACP methyl ester carboxylesterase